MSGVSRERDISDVFVCPTFVRSSVWWASCAVRAFISVQWIVCVFNVDSPFTAKSVLANLASC